MRLEFNGIPLSRDMHPGEAVVTELARRTVYRLDDTLPPSPEEKQNIEWLLHTDDTGRLNIEWAGAISELSLES